MARRDKDQTEMCRPQLSWSLNEHWKRKRREKMVSIGGHLETLAAGGKVIDVFRPPAMEPDFPSVAFQRRIEGICQVGDNGRETSPANVLSLNTETSGHEEFKNSTRRRGHYNTDKIPTSRNFIATRSLITFTLSLLLAAFVWPQACRGQSLIQSDPRPTIYSGQVSFGLLLSAHSSSGAELSTAAATQQVSSIYTSDRAGRRAASEENFGDSPAPSSLSSSTATMSSSSSTTIENSTQSAISSPLQADTTTNTISTTASSVVDVNSTAGQPVEIMVTSEDSSRSQSSRVLDKRQIFERNHRQPSRRQQAGSAAGSRHPAGSSPASGGEQNGICSQINTNALYAGMGAIWASHQANLVGDSQLAIGTYVYDSCNDLDVGQRQSVRIVSNLNAFQQTTCEAPRGSPISLTIAHGDNQLRAIQLLTSFKVPVITTREHFALEDYNQLSSDQKRFLFSTAPSSRHLAVGALRFSKSIVSRSTNSPKLPNRDHKMSSKNGLIVISNNLPARFINYLTELIPRHVNYVMHQSFQPIDQIKSVSALEDIFVKQDSSSGSNSQAESRLNKVRIPLKIEEEEEREVEGEQSERKRRKRNSLDSDSDSGESESTSGSDSEAKMLSPTILMFITRSEAIDLVTRLRNDLAEVSKYYSLIVTTREDISPALKTIFYSGGSRLCPGKAFYTISPKPDDIGEFNRYFRDTVQMEGETSDHPLICEFAKYQASSRKNIDLDDISTESVIKAVWSSAAAFKSVYRQQCSNLSYKPGGEHSDGTSQRSGRQSTSQPSSSSTSTSTSTSSSGSGKSECMVKMNKNMSTLVQRALSRLDVTINSTGLQALDGFRIKFDSLNELVTNKFSIKYINKECEITELGHYSGLGDSKLKLDEETLLKSIESTLPDPWPVSAPASTPAPVASAAPTTAGSSTTSGSDSPTGQAGSDSSASSADNSGEPETTSTSSKPPKTRGRRKNKQREGEPETGDSGDSTPSQSDDGESEPETDKSGQASDEAPLRAQRKRSRAETSRRPAVGGRKPVGRRRQAASPVLTALGGRNILPGGLTDTSSEQESTGNEPAAGTLSTKQMRKLKPFPTPAGTTLSEWLPATATVSPGGSSQSTRSPNFLSGTLDNHKETEQTDPAGGDLKTKATTQAPIFSTLPESGGNADLEPTSRVPKSINGSRASLLEVSASTQAGSASDYVTSPSISKNFLAANTFATPALERPASLDSLGFAIQPRKSLANLTTEFQPQQRFANLLFDTNKNYYRDLFASSPVPLSSLPKPFNLEQPELLTTTSSNQQQREGRFRIRSHLRWIYSSWFTLGILCLNICGALLTLYVLTFLLMKNCDGSLEWANQGLRSLHLLAIIVVFFGSTLFIVYPTPSLCLLRTSWFNFALVMLFGTLLLQTMQIRSLKSIGLGGRPNRLNQFLTFLFIVGVQVSFELQRWKYESANYINFVNHYLSSVESIPGSEEKKMSLLNAALANQLNPLNSFNDQVTPIVVQVSEQYQSLLHDYCLQQSDDFLQSQLYLCAIVFLLIIFSASIRNFKQQVHSNNKGAGKEPAGQLSSGAGGGGQFHFCAAGSGQAGATSGGAATSGIGKRSGFESCANLFSVTLIIAPIYLTSLLLHLYAQSSLNRDLVSSITMVLIAFATLIGIFLPILKRIHSFKPARGNQLSSSSSLNSSANQINNQLSSKGLLQTGGASLLEDGGPQPFSMFPEFAPTGLRRPSSGTCESSGSGSRRAFAQTKESRRNMGVALANLGPSDDSLRSMGFYADQQHPHQQQHRHSSGESRRQSAGEPDQYRQSAAQVARNARTGKGEKRLIMLDVDPCCPKHGIAAMSTATSK